LYQNKLKGFTLIELVMVIVILGVIAALTLPRFADLSRQAKISTLEGIAGSINATTAIVRSKAYVQGLSVSGANPGAGQSAYVVETEAGRAEVDWRNLCPESEAELADQLELIDYVDLSGGGSIGSDSSNRYTVIGFELPSNTNNPNRTTGCYVLYDSFGDPNCTVEVITPNC